MQNDDRHISVLLSETVDGLNLKKKGTAIDATAGAGGHSEKLAEAVGKGGTVVVLDADEASLQLTRDRLKGAEAKIVFVQGNFRNLKSLAHDAGVTQADGIMFDLGWRTEQLSSGKGLSFNADEPLLMLLSSRYESGMLTAKDIIANWDEDELSKLFREYGEERFSGRIARAIVEAREEGPIETARTLGEIIARAVPVAYRHGRIHPATRTFQALRIAVNDELSALKEGIADALDLLTDGGRVAVISFHSLEDRIVKQAFREAEEAGKGIRITKKPIVAGTAEKSNNPRSRSAKLRIFEKQAENYGTEN